MELTLKIISERRTPILLKNVTNEIRHPTYIFMAFGATSTNINYFGLSESRETMGTLNPLVYDQFQVDRPVLRRMKPLGGQKMGWSPAKLGICMI